MGVQDPRFKQVRFNANLTVVQTALLGVVARKKWRPKSDVLREALHIYLKERGIDDGLIYDADDFDRAFEKDEKFSLTRAKARSNSVTQKGSEPDDI